MNTIRLFMWGYQDHFQCCVQVAARDLCRTLDPNLRVDAFLVGLLVEQQEGRWPVCLEPEDCGRRPEEFSEVMEMSGHFRAIDPRSQLIHSLPIAQEGHRRQLEARSLRNSLLHALRRWERPGDPEYHCSVLMPVAGYLVSTVVRLTRKGDSREHRLPRVHSEERCETPISLLDAALTELLADCARALAVPSPENVARFEEHSTSEILRAAGSRLMEAPVWAGGNIEGIYGLFAACNGISSQRYEGAEGMGTLLISRRAHPNIRPTLALKKPVRLSEHRAARKLLEISAGGDSLLSDGSVIYGFGKTHGAYDQGAADMFKVRFTHHYGWELLHDEHRMMIVRYGEPRLPLQVIDERKFRGDVERIFPGRPKLDRLLELANAACRQRHGTILIVATAAEAEAIRLANQATLIEPTELTGELLRSVSAIDGAVLIDPSGICYAIGVILDGLATPEGDSARGARFNSCIRYLTGRSECLALIVSEDGSVEWLPNLIPQVSRAKLDEKCKELDEILRNEEPDTPRSAGLLTWLRDHSFYLSGETCAKANELMRKRDERIRQEGALAVLSPEFSCNPAMNDSYLI
jgi:hypothetical protein